MDTSRVSPAELIAGAGGLLLFLFLFLDWFGPLNAWQLFDFMDIVLAIVGLGAAVMVGMRVMGMDVSLPGPMVVGLAGFAAFWVVIAFLIEGDERKVGIWLALIATIVITYAALGGGERRPGPPRAPGP